MCPCLLPTSVIFTSLLYNLQSESSVSKPPKKEKAAKESSSTVSNMSGLDDILDSVAAGGGEIKWVTPLSLK